MQLLKDRILKDGIVKPGNILKVDSFLNHQMDITLINEIGKEFKRTFFRLSDHKRFLPLSLRHRHCLHRSSVFRCTCYFCQKGAESES